MPTKLITRPRLISRLHKSFVQGAIVVAAITVAGHASASEPLDWPKGPITLIVPFVVGGGGDTLGRLYGNQLSKALGTPVIIQNKSGAGGNIGTVAAANAVADGNTLVFGTNGTMGTNHALYKNTGFSIDDFEPVAIFGTTPLALVVAKDSPFRSATDFIEHARKNPKQLTCASAGNGTASHVACAMLQQVANIQIEHIPYRGTASAFIDMRGGLVSSAFDVTPNLMTHIKSGALRPLAVTMNKRVPALSTTPTLSESGVPGFDLVAWDGLFAPKGTPAARLDKLHAAMNTVNNNPEFRETMAERGTILNTMSRKEFAEMVKKEYVRMGAVAKKTGIVLD